ncbi:MAG TPA: Ig-like domain-containing protein [Candidatus Acidoferrales bacterium]|nr:Ig-like domain-containing protein [Candidatus Acidoferrales bacterium]
MNLLKCKIANVPGKLTLVTASLGFAFLLISQAGAQTSFGGNAQHTANYSPAAQNLNAVHWTTSIDLNNTGALAHYGAPLITPANTIFVPVKTGANGGFEINVFNAANGAPLYSLSTDYTQPSHNWILPYQPVLATSSETRLYYPGNGGTIYYVNNVDSPSHGAPVQQVFYTTLANYHANAAGFNSTVFINTPITADSSGNVFFGFRVDGTAPAPLSTTQSGFARIDPSGNATYVLAGTAAGDASIGRDTHNSGPALSNDQTTVYAAVKSPSTETYGYLLGLNSTTLATKYKVFLKDPRGNNANNATLLDDSTASPMVGPDNDVYFGIYGNPANGSRGFMLHFSGDLTVEKTPGGFGWDNTTGVVPASMVPSYTGTSSYLLFTKYNNYAGAGNDSADGVNRVALIDPTATQVDAHASSNGLLIMREVLTVIGPTADKENRSASLPLAVREWCINTPAINPATGSVFFPSEDGHIYRWNLAANSLTQFLQLNAGIGLPYVPTIIGPDGQVFTLNGGTMSALGSLSGVGIALASSTPDVRNVVTGQALTFSVAVTNTGTSGITPTGTVTLTDTVYFVPSPNMVSSTTITLASNVPLDANGNAAVTTSALTADKHFITVSYSGDTSFSAGSGSLIQFVHASGTTTAVAASPNPSNLGQSVAFTATVAAVPPGTGTPTGMVTFQDGNIVLGQVPLNGSGVASFSTSGLALGSHTVTAVYASDSIFAASSGSKVQVVQNTANTTTTTASSSPNPSVSGQLVTFTSTTTSSAGVPVGTVTFTEGATVWASNVTVNAGQASFSTAALSVGSHTITATFTGATGWGNSSGNAAPQVVNGAAATTTTASSSPNPSVFGQSVTFTSITTSTTGVPAGTVTFTEGATVWASNVTVNAGHASFSTTALTVASHTITATFTGAAGWANSSGNAAPQVVNKAATTTVVSSSANPSVYSQPVTFTATVTATAPGGGVPTGTVTFKNGNTTLGTGSLNGSGAATFTTSTLNVASHSITAVYGGSTSFNTSTSPVLTQTVNKDGTATTVTSSLNPSVHNQSVTFTATVAASAPGTATPTGTVAFKDGARTLHSGGLSGGQATYTTSTLSTGTHQITVVYEGNSRFLTSTSPVLVQTVN